VNDELGVFPAKPSALQELFGTARVVIGVVHLLPLPGGPHYRGQAVDELVRFAVEEGRAYREGGVHGLIVENGWDMPFSQPDDLGFETAASMAVIADRVREETGLPIGINVLANAASCSLAVAQAAQGGFVRVNQWTNAYVANEGLMNGQGPHAARERARIRAEHLKVFADVHVKHGSHSIVADRSLAQQAEDAEFFDADVLIATGSRTGDATPLDEIEGIKAASNLPVIIGSGMTEGNAGELLAACEGAIVASSLKENGRWWGRVDQARVKAFMSEAFAVGYEQP
jgi:uncharacterized protein